MPFERPVWPGGAACAVTLTFDNFGESLDLLRHGHAYGSLLREIVARGHEVGAHGWMHEAWDRLPPDEERELVARTTGTIGEVLGQAPRGWRSPGGLITPATLALLKDAGYRYDSSFSDDDIPYRIAVSADRPGDELVELPWSWALDDAPFYAHPNPMRRPSDLIAMWRDELDAA